MGTDLPIGSLDGKDRTNVIQLSRAEQVTMSGAMLRLMMLISPCMAKPRRGGGSGGGTL